MKEKKCKVCKQLFSPQRPLQAVCSPSCGLTLATLQRSKAERIAAQESRKTIRLQKEKLKTRSDYIKEAQTAANAFVRKRDEGKPCISCGITLASGSCGGGFDAGHFRSRGSAPHLRFDAERNIHGQCKRCNRYLSGNVTEYRRGLIERIGADAVDALEADNEPRKWSVEELKEIKAFYKAKLKELKQ